MTVFGVGTLELILILLLLILIFGPDRINEMGRWLGQAYRRLTGLSSEVNQQVMEVRRAMDSTLDTSSLTDSIKEAAAEVNSIQRDLNKSVAEGSAAVKGLRNDVENSIGGVEKELRVDLQEQPTPVETVVQPESEVETPQESEPEPQAEESGGTAGEDEQGEDHA